VNAPAGRVTVAAQLACLLEASAPKPGNVSPGRHFSDTRYEDFLASAAAIGPAMEEAGVQPIGKTIRRAVEATAGWARTNTNLGIVLLLAPLARAAVDRGSGDLRQALRALLELTTIDDARDVYAAIRTAAPGGLGRVSSEDVADEPAVTLLEAMRLAADRDRIAGEYTTGFEVTFAAAYPALAAARRDGLSWDDAIVETYLTLLARYPDTHIARRAGARLAADVTVRASAVLEAGGVRTPGGRRAIEVFDRGLRDPAHRANPGTTADLTTAGIFVLLVTEDEPI
jgi:triphosphoribosyl-dephospho-CoA synthase